MLAAKGPTTSAQVVPLSSKLFPRCPRKSLLYLVSLAVKGIIGELFYEEMPSGSIEMVKREQVFSSICV